MKAHTIFNIFIGTIASAAIGIAGFVAFCLRDWQMLAIFVLFGLVMVAGVAKEVRWLLWH